MNVLQNPLWLQYASLPGILHTLEGTLFQYNIRVRVCMCVKVIV